MKSIAAALLFLLLAPSLANAQDSASAAFKVGVTTRHVFPPEPYDWRGSGSHALLETVWYPADSGADAKPQLIPPVGTAIFAAAPAALAVC